MDFSNITNDLSAASEFLTLLKTNNITVAQAIAVAKGAEPILGKFGVTVPEDVHIVLALLGTIAGS